MCVFFLVFFSGIHLLDVLHNRDFMISFGSTRAQCCNLSSNQAGKQDWMFGFSNTDQEKMLDLCASDCAHKIQAVERLEKSLGKVLLAALVNSQQVNIKTS